MASSSNTSSGALYIAIKRVDQDVPSRMFLVDFAALDTQNSISSANELKHFVATLAGLPPTQVENQLVQLNEQVVTQASTIAEVRDRNCALMKEGRDLVEKKTNSYKLLALAQERVKDLEARVPVCTHDNIQNTITQLEQLLTQGVCVDMAELKQELEDAQEQQKLMGEERKKYRDQVKWLLALTGKDGSVGCMGHKGSEILRFCGADQRALLRWRAQLAMTIADEPGRFFNKQSKMMYAANQLEGVALNQIQPYIDRKTRHLKLESFDTLLDLLQFAFRDHNIRATANRELLKFRQKHRVFAQSYAEFQQWVPDVEWNEAAQLEVLWQGQSEELKDSL
jgi:hypothetical protein